MKISMPRNLQGWIWWLAIGVLLIALLGPKVEALITAKRVLSEKAALIVDYESRLSTPISIDRTLSYRSYVLSDSDQTDVANAVQSTVLELIRQNQIRLIDLRETETPVTLENLTAVAYRVELEGDLRAVLETLAAFGSSTYPILVDQMELRPSERYDRPDRLVRMIALLTIWTGAN